MKKLSNTMAELIKSLAYKKSVYFELQGFEKKLDYNLFISRSSPINLFHISCLLSFSIPTENIIRLFNAFRGYKEKPVRGNS